MVFVQYSSGRKYCRALLRGKRDGWGVYDNTELNYRYNGNWMDNKKHGIGNENDKEDNYNIIYENGVEISRVNLIISDLQKEICKIFKKNQILEKKYQYLEKRKKENKQSEIIVKINDLNKKNLELEKIINDYQIDNTRKSNTMKKLKEENITIRKENMRLLSKDIAIRKNDSLENENLKKENQKLNKEKDEIIKMYKDLIDDFDIEKINEIKNLYFDLKKELNESQSKATRYNLEKNVAFLKLKKIDEDYKNLKKNYYDTRNKISLLEKKLENENYLGKIFMNIENEISKLNKEYNEKLKKINDLEDIEKIKELENILANQSKKIVDLKENLYQKDKEINELKESDESKERHLKEKIENQLSEILEKNELLESIKEENNLQLNLLNEKNRIIDNYKSDRECKICMSKDSDIILMPCGHLAMCKSCELRSRRQTNQKCPICRKRYTELIKVYL